jgi:hypothetical protein
MLLGYVLPDSRHPTGPQEKALRDFGVEKIWIEAKRTKGDAYPEFEHLTGPQSGVIREPNSAVVVRDAHRLASNREDWRNHIELIHERGGFLIEVSTGRTSKAPTSLLAMWIETVAYFDGGKLSKEAARRIGKKGAKASPATKPLAGRKPFAEVQSIIDDNPTLTYSELVARINEDVTYKKPWHVSTLMYWRKKRRIKLARRNAGRQPLAPH